MDELTILMLIGFVAYVVISAAVFSMVFSASETDDFPIATEKKLNQLCRKTQS